MSDSEDLDDFDIILNSNQLDTDSDEEYTNKNKYRNRTANKKRTKKKSRIKDEDISFISGGLLNLNAETNEEPVEETKPKPNVQLNDASLSKLYGKGLNMIKKMGYKGGTLGTSSNIPEDRKVSQDYPKSPQRQNLAQDNYRRLNHKRQEIILEIKKLSENNLEIQLDIKLINNNINNKQSVINNINDNKSLVADNFKHLLSSLTSCDEKTVDDNLREEQLINKIIEILIDNNNLLKKVIKIIFKKKFKVKNDSNLDFVSNLLRNENVLSNPAVYNTVLDCVNYYLINNLITYYKSNLNLENIEKCIGIYNMIKGVKINLEAVNKFLISKFCKEIDTNLKTSHMVTFPFLEFLEDDEIEVITRKFTSKFEEEFKILSLNEGEKIDQLFQILNNWSSLLSNPSDVVYNVLYNKLTSYSIEDNPNDVSDVLRNVMKFEKMVNVKELLEKTIILSFRNHLTREISSTLSYSAVESCVDLYLKFKSSLPDYINSDKNIQNNYYRPILQNIDLYVNKSSQ
uniref:G-patch domain-containing protein n=1 Tax=Theileria annulata TaxID=5874 RepID=A0A3B0MR50_THEAN